MWPVPRQRGSYAQIYDLWSAYFAHFAKNNSAWPWDSWGTNRKGTEGGLKNTHQSILQWGVFIVADLPCYVLSSAFAFSNQLFIEESVSLQILARVCLSKLYSANIFLFHWAKISFYATDISNLVHKICIFENATEGFFMLRFSAIYPQKQAPLNLALYPLLNCICETPPSPPHPPLLLVQIVVKVVQQVVQ